LLNLNAKCSIPFEAIFNDFACRACPTLALKGLREETLAVRAHAENIFNLTGI